jgi:hypothetical protein
MMMLTDVQLEGAAAARRMRPWPAPIVCGLAALAPFAWIEITDALPCGARDEPADPPCETDEGGAAFIADMSDEELDALGRGLPNLGTRPLWPPPPHRGRKPRKYRRRGPPAELPAEARELIWQQAIT